MQNSLVSIIIPTYNRAHLIGETLESVLAQTYQNWECIVIDDGSTDYTDELLEFHTQKGSRISFYHRPQDRPKGANACRNFGFEKSMGHFIIFLDSDDMLDPGCLQIRIEMMKKNPDLDFVVFSMGLFTSFDDPKVDKNRKVFYFDSNEKYIDQFLKGPLPWSTTRPIYRREFLEKTNGFDAELLLFQDPEFHIRVLFLLNPNFLVLDKTDCYYRVGSHQVIKYNNKEFRANLVSQYFLLRSKHVQLFQGKYTHSMKKSLVRSFIKISRNYSNSHAQFKILSELLLLYKEEKVISLEQKFSMWIILLINTFYKDRPGFYSLNKKLERRATL